MDKKLTGQFGTCMSPEQAEIASAIATLREQFASGTNNVHELIALAERVQRISRELEVYGFITDEDDDPDFFEEEGIDGIFANKEELSGYKRLWEMVCGLYEEILMKLATHEDVLGHRWCAYHDGLEYPAVGKVLAADNDELVQFLVANAGYDMSLDLDIQNSDYTKTLNILVLMAESGIEGLVEAAVDGFCLWHCCLKSIPQNSEFQKLFADNQHRLQKLAQMYPSKIPAGILEN